MSVTLMSYRALAQVEFSAIPSREMMHEAATSNSLHEFLFCKNEEQHHPASRQERYHVNAQVVDKPLTAAICPR